VPDGPEFVPLRVVPESPAPRLKVKAAAPTSSHDPDGGAPAHVASLDWRKVLEVDAATA
jgi:hypothetical protein